MNANPETPRPPLPCQKPCPKCGSTDIYRRFHYAGDDCGIVEIKAKTSIFVNRSAPYDPRVLTDCIVHSCRVCGYVWDTAPLPCEEDKYYEEAAVFLAKSLPCESGQAGTPRVV